MENPALWVAFIVAAALAYRRFMGLGAEACALRDSVALLRAELDALRESQGELAEDIERVTLTPTELEVKHFDRLPALTSDQFALLSSGERLHLVLKTYTDQGFPIFYAVEYTHQELTYRTPGKKDAAAQGEGRLDTSDELRDVRILFSRPHATAALRGLALDGHVKEGRLLPNISFKPNPLRGSA